jgi:DNA-binding NarL/FixJ family response regulator
MLTETLRTTAEPDLSPSVVLLEDHGIVRESLANLLESGGIRVLGQFADGESFLSALNRLSPDVALIDLGLEPPGGEPAMDGLGVLRAIRGMSCPVKPIVLSAIRSPEVIQESYRAGAAAYLYKLDASRKSMIATIRAVARGERLVNSETFQAAFAGPSAGVEAASPLQALTHREREVLACIATGADNLKIAALLDITERTVRAHVSSLYRKLQA